MVSFRMSQITQIKHWKLQTTHESWCKNMRKKYEQDKVVLPIPCVRDDGFDPETFLEASGMQWDSYFALKRLRIEFSVFEFSWKSAKLFMKCGAA